MKDKEIIEKVDELSKDEKLSLWVKYMVDVITLNHDYKVINGKYFKGDYYPQLDITIWKYMDNVLKHRVEPFESWIVQKENNHDLTGIYSYYRKVNIYNKLNWNKYNHDTSVPNHGNVKKVDNVIEPYKSNCGCKKQNK